jgi:alkylated DNA repair dioxygenase AlkB
MESKGQQVEVEDDTVMTQHAAAPRPAIQPETVLQCAADGNGNVRACAIVIRNALGTDLANKLFTFLSDMPRDTRPVEDIKVELLPMNSEAYAAYQRRVAGFTRDRYPFFKALSAREVVATVKPKATTKKTYRYSGQTRHALPMKDDDPVYEACQHVSQLMQTPFTFALINRYDGIDEYISHHKDDEKDLAQGAPIVSCVVGASRTFEFKLKRKDKKQALPKVRGMDKYGRVRILLHHGDVLAIVAQGRFTHSVPKRGPGIMLEPHVTPDGTSTNVRYSVTLRQMSAK